MGVRIDSFSSVAFRKLLTSDTYNPSSCYLRRVPAGLTIADTFQQNLNLNLNYWEKRPVRVIGGVCRVAARMATAVAIGTVLAPAGAIYHLGKMAKHTVLLLQRGVPARHNWELVKQHAEAFFHDFIVGLWTYAGIAATVITPAAVFLNLIPLAAAIGSISLCYNSVRDPAVKSFILRESFGIVGLEGQLLPVGAGDDENLDYSGLFGRAWQIEGRRLLEEVYRIKALVPDLDIPFIEGSTNGYKTAEFLRSKAFELAPLRMPYWDLQSIIHHLERYQANIDKLRETLNICFRRHNPPNAKFIAQRFPYPPETCRAYYQGQIPAALNPYDAPDLIERNPRFYPGRI